MPHDPTHFGSHLLDPLCFPKAHLDKGGPKFDLFFHAWLHQQLYIHYIIHYNVKGGQQLPFFLLAPVPPVQPSMLLAFFVVAAHGWLTFHGAFFSRAVTKLASSLYPHVRLFTPGTEL